MFALASLIGLYSYAIFFLGIFHHIYFKNIIFLTIVFIISILLIIWQNKKLTLVRSRAFFVIFVLISLQAVINLIGALGPETAFDALWYHLTLPKLYIQEHAIFFSSNGLLYYSTMPKLAEMFYIAALSISNEIFAKIIHWGFGLLTCLVLYKFSRKFLNPIWSLFSVLIFYANLVAGWESITAYIDLVRTFFEVMAVYLFFKWMDDKKNTSLTACAIMLGLAITTKILAIGSLVIFCLLTGIFLYKHKTKLTVITSKIILFILVSLLIPSPWFIFSYVHTKNIFYPFFSSVYQTHVSLSLLNPLQFLHDVLMIFTRSQDPISPVYIAFLPLVLLAIPKQKLQIKLLLIYSLLSLIIWYITPRTGGGRFILPYLPVYSLITAQTINFQKNNLFKKICIGFVVIIGLISIAYRLAANLKYIPVITGTESKQAFLTSHLNFNFGDFYDTNGYFEKHIKPKDTVLLIGFHNLYYVNFSFTLDPKSNKYNYIATQHALLPKQFANWHLIYHNATTGVNLYKY